MAGWRGSILGTYSKTRYEGWKAVSLRAPPLPRARVAATLRPTVSRRRRTRSMPTSLVLILRWLERGRKGKSSFLPPTRLKTTLWSKETMSPFYGSNQEMQLAQVEMEDFVVSTDLVLYKHLFCCACAFPCNNLFTFRFAIN